MRARCLLAVSTLVTTMALYPISAAAVTSTAPVVSTTSGTFQGAAPDANGVASFKGMPYAAPPIGPLRWRPPQPVQPAPGVTPATAFGDACLAAPGPEPDPADLQLPHSENCLTVNVWSAAVPAATTKKATPKAVMVYLHGGGFEFGSSAEPTYDGSNLATKEVVVVSLNYRLGVFGFLATSQFDTESGGSGDWGLQDQLAALRWVQSNIAQFGGDPKRVTLFGESAGAHAVGMLMASPKSPGLFSKAIIESGATWDTEHGSISTHQEALTRGSQFQAKFAGQDLRAVPAAAINAAAPWDYVSDPTITAFSPSIDGNVLTDSPMNVFLQKKQLHIPLLGGWNAAEYFYFPGHALVGTPPEAFYAAAAQMFGPNCVAAFQKLYPPTDAATAEPSALQLAGDEVIAEQTWEALMRQTSVANTFAYHFTYSSAYSPLAIHTAELQFVFGNFTPEVLAPTATPSAGDRALSAQMMSYWTNFAKNGNPNASGLPAWPTTGSSGSRVLEIDATPAAAANPDLARFSFIAKYRVQGRLPAQWRTTNTPLVTTYQGPACPA